MGKNILYRSLFLCTLTMPLLYFITLSNSIAGSNDRAYIGAKECITCHIEQYKGWKATFHPYKFQPVSDEAVIGDFVKNNVLETDGFTIKMSKKDGNYYITTHGPGKEVHSYKIKYLIGGFWKQHYVTEFKNGEFHILPAVWIAESGKWEKTGYWPDTVYQNSCIKCHNTGVELNYDETSKSFNTTWTDFGVSCEACHGPGSEHVKSGDSEKHSTIINPAKIPDPRRAAMICGSCHNRGSSPDGRFGYPEGYEPGGNLEFIFNEKPKLHPDDSTKANRQQYIDWKKSGHASEGIMCWDCHYSHQKGNSNKYQTKLPGSALCRSCHHVGNKGIHGIHSVNNCVGCHMPPVGKRAVKGDVHSHTFRVIGPEKTMNMGGDVKGQPNSCNACHYHWPDSPEKMLKIMQNIKKKGLEMF